MATLVLKAAGTALGGPVGGFLAGMVGAYLDQRMLTRVLTDTPKPQKVGDLDISTAEEGAPMPFLMGPEVRTPAHVIWKGPERAVEQNSGGGGGCGGGPSESPSYGYFSHIAVAIGQPPPGARIQTVTKIFADGRALFQDDADVNVGPSFLLSVAIDNINGRTARIITASHPATPIAITTSYPLGTVNYDVVIAGCLGNTACNGQFFTSSAGDYFLAIPATSNGVYTGGGTATRVTKRMRINSPNGGPDLSQFRAGHDVVVLGFFNALNNGTFECISAGIDSVTGITHVILDNRLMVVEAAGNSVTLHQDLPQFNPLHFSGPATIHDGSPWQQPDSLMVTTEGNHVSGHQGVAYAVLPDFNLTHFGDRIPNITCLSKVTTTWTVGESIAAILQRYNFDSSEYDVSDLSAIPCRGYFVVGPVTGKSALESILVTFDIVTYQVDDKLYFVRRRSLVAIAIPTAELAAHPPGTDVPRNSLIRSTRDRSLPREVQVKYQNPLKEYQGDMEPYRAPDRSGDNPVQYDTGITMSPGPAQDCARRMYWTARVNRDPMEIRLPPSQMLLHEGNLLQYTDIGETRNMLVRKIDWAFYGGVICEGPNEVAGVLDYDGSSTSQGGAGDSGGPGVLEAVDLHIIDEGPLSDSHVQEPGVYIACSPRAPGSIWLGAILWENTADDDASFTSVLNIQRTATTGRTLGALGGGVSAYMIDRKNTIDVLVTYGSNLSSISEDQMVRNESKNRIMIGREMLAYADATLIGTNTYRIATLLRGLRDTGDYIDLHTGVERVIVLDTNHLRFIPQSLAFLNSTRYYKAVVTGGVLADYPTIDEWYDANTVRPFTVCNVLGSRNPAGDLVSSWDYQTRNIVRVFSQNTIPFNEPVVAYEIEVMDALGLAVKRTITSSTPTITYLASDQVIDFGSAQASINLQIYQMGALVGRGRVKRVTL